MICNYQNITDYCTNKFTYEYADVSQSSVIRTDKDTGEVLAISPDTNLFVEPCDSNDLVEVISFWECYQIFVNTSTIPTQDVSIDKIVENTNTIVSSDYDLSLSDGVPVTIPGMNTILLDGSMNNQIHLGNIGALCIILYNLDPQNVMPYILDVNNISYSLNYSDLQYLLTEYFTKVALKKNIKDDALKVLDSTSSNLTNNTIVTNFCSNKIPSNVQKGNITIDYSLFKPIISLPPNICDPACDPNSCESCVNGSCESLCGENQYCCDGVCQDEQCDCENNTDCNAGECCNEGQCGLCECGANLGQYDPTCPFLYWGYCSGYYDLVYDQNGALIDWTTGQWITSGPFVTEQEVVLGDCPAAIVQSQGSLGLGGICCENENGNKYCYNAGEEPQPDPSNTTWGATQCPDNPTL